MIPEVIKPTTCFHLRSSNKFDNKFQEDFFIIQCWVLSILVRDLDIMDHILL